MASLEAPAISLDLALTQLGRRDRAGALEALLAAWRASRAPAIADLVDALSPQLEAERPTLALGGNKHAAWLEALASATTADLPRLYEAIPDARFGLPAKARLAQLRDRPADPRLSAHLWTWLREVASTGTTPNSTRSRA